MLPSPDEKTEAQKNRLTAQDESNFCLPCLRPEGSGWVFKCNAVGFLSCLFPHKVALGLGSSLPQEQVRRLIWSSQDSLALGRDAASGSNLISSPGTKSLLMMTAKATLPALPRTIRLVRPMASTLLTPLPQIRVQRRREAKELVQVSGLQVY